MGFSHLLERRTRIWFQAPACHLLPPPSLCSGMRSSSWILIAAVTTCVSLAAQSPRFRTLDNRAFDDVIASNEAELMRSGRQIFRFDTFGDERFWGDTLKLHQAIEGVRFGGVGGGVGPATALAVGLKVDSQMVPNSLLAGIKSGAVDLSDPANTLALINMKAVVGVIPFGRTSA